MSSSYAKISKCPLCQHKADYFLELDTKFGIRNYYKCINCASIHLAKADILVGVEEKERYAMHNNDVEDLRYQEFVSPVTHQIIKNQDQRKKGLDYGCGPGPVITHVLEQSGFDNIQLYDPFFHPNQDLLNQTYDFIICCEVIEHFMNPKNEFSQLKKLLRPGAVFYGKTELLDANVDTESFKEWWYKNDPTHCFFYSKETLAYIQENFNFKSLKMHDKLFELVN